MDHRNDTPRYEAYCAFMKRHRQVVWSVCMHYAHSDRELCRDMVQDVWLALWLRFEKLHTNAPEWQQVIWLQRTARSVVLDIYRRDKLVTETLSDKYDEMLEDRQSEYAEIIDDFMAHLSPYEQQLLQMRLDGYNATEIGAALGIERNNVYQRMYRIIKKLRLVDRQM